MKVILTGSTGFIGQEVLSQCLANPSISSIIVLSRRALPLSHPKIHHVHRMQESDFLSYSTPELTAAIQGADACIWSLGTVPSRVGDSQINRRVSVDFTAAAARAFQQQQGTSRRFRFVYVSGGLAERDQSRPLWFSAAFRRIRGDAENVLISAARENPDTFEEYIMRPGLVVGKDGTVIDMIRGLWPSVRVDILAKAMVETAVNGNQKRFFENAEIQVTG
ncbi:Nucleoside-diphosphate-sugar epimerase [Aspergillus sp. HF37]|nr:Nucleoside-diphosphate-sugar epimerase [Aspergillus sp. HF37]